MQKQGMGHWQGMGRAATVFATLVVLCVAVRVAGDRGWIDCPPNFKPLAGAALLAGMLFRDLRWAIGVPLAAMIASDAVIGGYEWRMMVCVYGALLLPVMLGSSLRKRFTLTRLITFTLASSLFFFAMTNLGVWLFTPLYEGDLAGLQRCFIAAIPFFKYTLAGDFLWTAALFGGYFLATRRLSIFERLGDAVSSLTARPAKARVRKQ